MTKSRLWESRRAALLLGKEPSGILWPEQCELLSKKWILHKSGSANCHIILQIIRVLLIGNLHASFKSSIGKGPYKQTGQAQIGPILPSPSFSHHQAITRPPTNQRSKEGVPIPHSSCSQITDLFSTLMLHEQALGPKAHKIVLCNGIFL